MVEICIPFPLIAAGEQHVSSSLAAILIAAVPLIVALLALRFDAGERAPRAAAWRLLWASPAWWPWWASTWPGGPTS